MSGTRKKIADAATNVATASKTKTPRHDITDSAAASGSVDSSAPQPPATIIQPPRDACRSREYHIAIAVSGAIRQTETPAPMSARENASSEIASLAANASAPQPATARRTGSARLGPYRSSSMPAGICIAANATKYALVKRPSDDALIPSVSVSSGEITALTLRKTYDSK